MRTGLERADVAAVEIDKEIIVVDDHSSDETLDQIKASGVPDVRVIHHAANRGKGAAVRSGLEAATGDVVVIQDGDLEYDPKDFVRLIEPIRRGEARVVYGYRDLSSQTQLYRLGNRFLTLLTNLLFGVTVRDMETCYKVFRSEALASFEIEEDRFGVEPEITAKLAKGRWRIYEVGISYSGRTYEEGKKIGWRDGVHALQCIVKYNLFRD